MHLGAWLVDRHVNQILQSGAGVDLTQHVDTRSNCFVKDTVLPLVLIHSTSFNLISSKLKMIN